MISTIIIDDELHCIQTLLKNIELHCPQVKVITTCQSGKEGIDAIKKHNPDLVFLDVEMPEMNGFEMLDKMSAPRDFQLIFTTTYDQFVLRAMRASAIDYLMKPIDGPELAQAIERVEKQLRNNNAENHRIVNLISNSDLDEDDQRIALPDRHGYIFVSPAEICYCKAEGAYTHVYLTNERKILISKALGETEIMLPPRTFERIHHSSIVNLAHIRQLKKGDGLFIIMSNGDSLSVARSKKDHLLSRLGVK
ncbi:LytTR family DNA-binding domain-containing protein [Dyadobacter sp. CY345]|uniref:LytR/AlgR family response regulator transcription factor n=1 Tax=Dyadobacter sp. CY345 TaxID=2909335 RepID=UPI001F353AD2|nr:LytTR family DNA-binding domain-containing protein [Dyadobacter sp. CY345]MCF2446572.1 LytTR family DNA-binding domain-containing protein [Dyadobacter sp. CY345]